MCAFYFSYGENFAKNIDGMHIEAENEPGIFSDKWKDLVKYSFQNSFSCYY